MLDRNLTFPEADDMPGEYSRVLVLHREVLDLDDYGFSLPGKEDSEDEANYVPGFFNDVMFWIDEDGDGIGSHQEQHCLPPANAVESGGDCNDADDTRHCARAIGD